MGFNIALSRRDFETVNGFDEDYVGWGCEDDDLAVRLRLAGIRIAAASASTHVFHLWHPDVPSHPGEWRRGSNVERLLCGGRPVRCRAGLTPILNAA
jgi:GT2 family glycosyltransferase